MLKVLDITTEKLKNNELINEVPEIYELKKVFENNAWHNNVSVFNHTIKVLENLEDSLKMVNDNVKSYLNQVIDKNTRKQLLFLGAVFHDIAKKETLVKNGNSTSCSNHEEHGSEKVKNILNRIDLSGDERRIIIQIVRYHGEMHNILNPKNEKLEEQYEDFKSKFSHIFLELILLAKADTLGCELKDKLPDEFNFRMNFYNEIINNY